MVPQTLLHGSQGQMFVKFSAAVNGHNIININGYLSIYTGRNYYLLTF